MCISWNIFFSLIFILSASPTYRRATFYAYEWELLCNKSVSAELFHKDPQWVDNEPQGEHGPLWRLKWGDPSPLSPVLTFRAPSLYIFSSTHFLKAWDLTLSIPWLIVFFVCLIKLSFNLLLSAFFYFTLTSSFNISCFAPCIIFFGLTSSSTLAFSISPPILSFISSNLSSSPSHSGFHFILLFSPPAVEEDDKPPHPSLPCVPWLLWTRAAVWRE